MSHFTLLLLVGIAGWIAYRMYGNPFDRRRDTRNPAPRRPAARVERPAAPPRPDPRTIDVTPLERDPKTGVYRPVDRKN